MALWGHASVGKASMPADQLKDNVLALVASLMRLKPATAKGTYVRSVALSTTMGPAIRLDANDVVRASAERR